MKTWKDHFLLVAKCGILTQTVQKSKKKNLYCRYFISFNVSLIYAHIQTHLDCSLIMGGKKQKNKQHFYFTQQIFIFLT